MSGPGLQESWAVVSVISSMVTASGGPGGPARERDPQTRSRASCSNGQVTRSPNGMGPDSSDRCALLSDSSAVTSSLNTPQVPALFRPLKIQRRTGRGPFLPGARRLIEKAHGSRRNGCRMVIPDAEDSGCHRAPRSFTRPPRISSVLPVSGGNGGGDGRGEAPGNGRSRHRGRGFERKRCQNLGLVALPGTFPLRVPRAPSPSR